MADKDKSNVSGTLKQEEARAVFLQNQFAQAITNTLMTRRELVASALDPRRDLNIECGYIDDPQITDFATMYAQEGIARRVVHILPKESWQVDPEIVEDSEADSTPFEEAWADLAKDLSLYGVLARADALSGIGQFGIILLGLDDGQELNQEVTKKEGLQILYLRVFAESVVKIAATEGDVNNPRYGLPVLYDITFDESILGGTTLKSRLVHWTRVIHLADNREMSEVLGVPRMRPVFNRLQDLRKILGGSAEMFWQGAFPGLSFEVNPDLLADGVGDFDDDALKEQMQNYANGLQRWLSTTGVSVKSLAPQVANPKPHVDEQLRAMSISIGVPFRVFMGTEEGVLAGGQDAKAWAKRVGERQEKYLSPYVVRNFIDRLIALGVLPEPMEYSVEWPDMMAPSDQEKAEVVKTTTETLKAYISGSVDAFIPPELFMTHVLGWEPELVEAVGDAVLKIEEEMRDEEEVVEEGAVPGEEKEEEEEEVVEE